jgi:hypothetical protein
MRLIIWMISFFILTMTIIIPFAENIPEWILWLLFLPLSILSFAWCGEKDIAKIYE